MYVLAVSDPLFPSLLRYLLLTLPALYLHSVHECMGRFLLAQGIVAPGVVISAITAAMTPVFCYVLVCK